MTAGVAPVAPRPIAGSIGRALLFILLFFAATLAAQGLLTAPVTWLVERAGVHVRFGELMVLCGALAATAVMIRAIDVRPWRDLGLDRQSARALLVARGAVAGGVPIAGACVVLLLLGWLRLVPALPGSTLTAAVTVTAFLVPAALYEELVCRGYLLTAVRDCVGAGWAIGLTSVMFGLLHLQNPGATLESVLIVTLAGIFLAAVRVVYDSLYAAWAAHVAWNWVMAVPLHAAVSGQRFASPDYRMVSAGPDWITGGSWGPEGGFAAALAMVAALLYLYSRRRREESIAR